MIKHPFKVADALNPHMYALLGEVARIVKAACEPTGISDAILLEEFGTTLTQCAWVDETGYYITFRPHPIYSHLDRVKDALKDLEKRFVAQFKLATGHVPKVALVDPGDRNT